MKYIKRKSAVKPITGSIVDTTNIDDKTVNTYSARVIDKMLSYSTTEQVIGTWIDGKPLYRKVIQVTIPSTSTDGSSATASYSVSDNVNSIIYIRGYSDITTGTSYRIYFPFFATSTGYSVLCRATGSTVQMLNYVKAFSGFTAYLTVEYTKTTD